MRRLTILLATVAAFLLVPVAQAAASGTAFVSIQGHGKGKVSSVGGVAAFESEEEELNEFFDEFGPIYEGSPPIECRRPPPTGTCETPLVEDVENVESIALHAVAAPGSEFRGWTIEEGSEPQIGCEVGGNATAEGETPRYCLYNGRGGNLKVTALFCKVGQSLEACLATGPTNRALLTLTKSAGGTGGIGAVSSKPKGINCAGACEEAVASMYKNTPVVLKEKPATGSTFVEWKGACSGSGETCTVPMAEAESVEAIFGGTSKAILEPKALTFSKGESTGYGTVKASGLACESECTSETVLYQGPTGVFPKNKPGKTVILKAVPSFGSQLSGWTGCASNPTPSECSVTMEEAAEVTAEFSAKPTTTLTVDKLGTGTGAVSSKPKAINCAATCTTQDATVPTGEAVILKEKPVTGMTFEGWTGACTGAGETCTVTLSEAGTVHAKFGGSPKPILEAKELTLTKAGSGYGTVKASGLTCEVLCTSTVSLYQGPTGVFPKNKPGKTVILKATSAPGTQQVSWSGCASNPTPTECSVVMEEAEEVTATFEEIE